RNPPDPHRVEVCMTRPNRRLAAALLLCAGLAISGCTPDRTTTTAAPTDEPPLPPGAIQLVAFDSCDAAPTNLRGALKEAVGPYGLPGNSSMMFKGAMEGDRAQLTDGQAAVPAPAGEGTSYSGTNTHEVGVDEPDLVKTDGKRIVVVSPGVLRVVNAA